jgi:preprotein translocase subunit SecG
MQTVLIVIHLMIVLAMVGLVLLQRSEGGGLGMGGGGGFMTNRGTTNVLSRTTAILAGAFFVTSLVLSVMAGYERKPTSILGTGSPSTTPAPAGTPAPPISSGGGGVLDALKQGQQGGQQQPSGPQVPRSQ